MLCRTLTGLFRKSAFQPAHGPPVHPSDSGKAVLPSLPGSSPLPSSRKSLYHHCCTVRLDFVYHPPRFRIVRLHPFFQVIRPAAVECPVRTFQKICIVHVFSISRRYRHPPVSCPDIPCSLTLYMLCKRQWDHGIHHRSPKA